MMAPRTACGGSFLILLLLPVLSLGAPAGEKPSIHQATYVGIGYNILTANPEGSPQTGGVDPGLEPNRRVFAHTYDDGKITSDNMHRVPDEVSFTPRSSVYTSEEKDTFFGAKSYAKKLGHQVAVEASVSALFASFEFAASHKYESVKEDANTNGYVFFSKQSIENYGQIRLLLEKAEPSETFISAVCGLPVSYGATAYMSFLDDWGTHVVKEADLGVRSGTNYKEDRSSFIKDASTDMSNSVSVGGSYKIFSASLAVNMDKFTKSSASEKQFGKESTKYTVGSKEYNEPIHVDLMGLNEALDDKYWSKQSTYTACPSNWPRSTIQANILKAFGEYPAHKGVNAPATDPVVDMPLTWPEGKYALPEAATLSGDTCPTTDYMEWSYGMYYQNTENGNSCSKTNHLTNYCENNKIRTYYCVKTVPSASETSWTWTPGVYCILKYGDKCPTGFNDGFIKWNDGDQQKGIDLDFSTMPAGDFTSGDTKMDFCCREDGSTTRPIFLPTESSFYLIKFHSSCQQVHGMTVSEEYIQWATKTANPAVWQDGSYPLPGNTGHDVKISYCFYEPSTSAKREVEEVRELLHHLLEKQIDPGNGIVANESPKGSESEEERQTEDLEWVDMAGRGGKGWSERKMDDEMMADREVSEESEEEEEEEEEEGDNANVKRMEQLLNLLAKHDDIDIRRRIVNERPEESGREEDRQIDPRKEISEESEESEEEEEGEENANVKRMEQLLNLLAKHDIDIRRRIVNERPEESGREEDRQIDPRKEISEESEESEEEEEGEENANVKRMEQLLNLLAKHDIDIRRRIVNERPEESGREEDRQIDPRQEISEESDESEEEEEGEENANVKRMEQLINLLAKHDIDIRRRIVNERPEDSGREEERQIDPRQEISEESEESEEEEEGEENANVKRTEQLLNLLAKYDIDIRRRIVNERPGESESEEERQTGDGEWDDMPYQKKRFNHG